MSHFHPNWEEELEFLFGLFEGLIPRRRRAHTLRFRFSDGQTFAEGDNMTISIQSGNQRTVIGNPVTAENPPKPSSAKLSNQVFTSSDSAIFTVTPDPATPGGAIVKSVAVLVPGAPQVSATLTETATATEPDGTTTEQIQGVSTVVIVSAPPPPPPPAASIEFTFGPETPIPAPAPAA